MNINEFPQQARKPDGIEQNRQIAGCYGFAQVRSAIGAICREGQ